MGAELELVIDMGDKVVLYTDGDNVPEAVEELGDNVVPRLEE